ncbi:phosphate ABC transporter permease PstA [Catellatospora citrea]|uniref:Phosphate transport system permease protein PstA n=1 Tax=Catellatospora citrea TaxID=53366 RepID=A0A8J3KBT0_9ACTN|nr:phosphate ABC transporter permease PstA [Catellatospora citrea]RKE11261.1 phosphate ABC transporter membrane protein 2 (PhoT family) [Catellatospora citrea]GIF96727.1 phosphate transport system permease protein PstA [Catellatospora citrea]
MDLDFDRDTMAETGAPLRAADVRRDAAVPERPAEPRRDTGGGRGHDRLRAVGAGAGALSLTWLVFGWIAPFDGLIGFVTVAYVLFLALYAVLVALDEDGPAVRDRIAAAAVHSIAFLLLSTLAFIVLFTMWSGREALSHLNFYVEDMAEAGPLDPLTKGGIVHAVVGTLVQITLALSVTLPLGLATAVFLAETRGAFTRFVRTVVEAMTALPSIVAGLFVYAALILGLGVPTSGFAASMAISVMMLPIVIRASDVVLRVVPGSLREASLALGASTWRTVWHVVLPTARSGLATALILGSARGLGETSPVLITAGATTHLNADPFSGPQVSLPLATFNLIRSPQLTMVARGFGAAAVLMVVVLVLFAFGRYLGRARKGR